MVRRLQCVRSWRLSSRQTSPVLEEADVCLHLNLIILSVETRHNAKKYPTIASNETDVNTQKIIPRVCSEAPCVALEGSWARGPLILMARSEHSL